VRAIETESRGRKELKNNAALFTDSEHVAAEVDEKYGRDVMITPIEIEHPSDKGHRYMFTVPELPWKKE
jgi:hypothetical protein